MATITQLLEVADNTTATSTTTASITVASGRPLVVTIAIPTTTAAVNVSAVTFNSGAQSLTLVDSGTITATNSQSLWVWELASPTGGTGTVTITHTSTSSYRAIKVYEISGATSGAGYRDAAVKGTNSATTHELTITSATGDLPFAAIGWRNVSSAPSITNNAASTTVNSSLQGGTTVRTRGVTGTGAASVTLGGTSATSTESVLIGFNINDAAGGTAIAAISSGYHMRGMR